MIFCPSCRRHVPDSRDTCSYCGGPLREQDITDFINWVDRAVVRAISVVEASRRMDRPDRPFCYDVLDNEPLIVCRNGTQAPRNRMVRGAVFSQRPLSNVLPGQGRGNTFTLDPAPGAYLRSIDLLRSPNDKARSRQIRILKQLQVRLLNRDDIERVNELQNRIDRHRDALTV